MTDLPHLHRLLDEATDAASRGDHDTAQSLAAEVLRRDPGNRDALLLVEHAQWPPGELRRLTILFCDLVGSTAMSGRHDPETYGRLLELYHRNCQEVVESHGGTVVRRIGDGVLALFGHPHSHEDDTRRAVRAALGLNRRFIALRDDFIAGFGEPLVTRIAVHHGLVHLDFAVSDIYGLAPNLAARVQELAAPDTVVVTDDVAELVGGLFELTAQDPVTLRGIDQPISCHVVTGEAPRDPRRGRAWSTPFVGREPELDAVRTNLEGDAGLTVIVGEPGVGKSRLAAEVTAGLDDRTIRILCCAAEDAGVGFAAITSLLRVDPDAEPAPTSEGRLRNLLADLRTLGLDTDMLPLLAPLLDIPPDAGYEPVELDLPKVYPLRVDAVVRWCQALARHRPTMILIEDLQWIDAPSAEVIVTLARSRAEGLTLLATSRPEQSRVVGRFVETVEVGPLDLPAATELVNSVQPDLDTTVALELIDRAEGNPFFLEELTRAGMAGIVADLPAQPADTTIPAGMYDAIASRLFAPGNDVGLAQAAATIGRRFGVELLEVVSLRSRELTLDGLGTLIDSGVIEPDGAGYQFHHQLTRDLAYEVQSSVARAAIHGRVADALRDRRAEGTMTSWATIAFHDERAGRIPMAVQAYGFAADEARDRGLLGEAKDLLSTGIGLVEQATDLDPLAEVPLRLKRAFLGTLTAGNSDPEARADYERCLEVCERQEPGPELIDAYGSLAAWSNSRADFELTDHCIARLTEAGAYDDLLNRLDGTTTAAIADFFRGRFVHADAQLADALGRVDPTAELRRPRQRWQMPNDLVAMLLLFHGLTRWQRGDLVGFREGIQRALRRSRALTFPHGPYSEGMVLNYDAWVSLEIGELERAGERLDQLEALAGRHGFDIWMLSAAANRAFLGTRIELARTEPDPAELTALADRMANSTMIGRMLEALTLVPYSLAEEGAARSAAGDDPRALALLDDAIATAHSTGSCFFLAESHRQRARVRHRLGDTGAIEDLERAADIAAEQGSLIFELRALSDLANLGDERPRYAELLSTTGLAAAAGVTVELPTQ